MKIVFIISGLCIGGAETVLVRLIENIDRSKFEPYVISLTDEGDLGFRIREMNVELYSMNMSKDLFTFFMFFKLVRTIAAIKPDIVHTFMYHSDLVGGLASKLAGVDNIIWGVRNTDVFVSKGVSRSTGWLVKFAAFLSPFIPRVITYVAFSALENHKKIGFRGRDNRVIGNGFICSGRESPRENNNVALPNFGENGRYLVVGSVGRYNPYKDHSTFVLAAEIAGTRDPRLRFVMAGRDIDWSNDSLRVSIQSTKMSERFLLLGQRSDIPDLMSSFDIFCLHSASEGFPNVLGEAMSVGCCCVTTDVGDARRLISETGLVVQPRNAHQLAEAILRLASLSAEERAELGKRSRGVIYSQHSVETMVENYQGLYREVFSNEN